MVEQMSSKGMPYNMGRQRLLNVGGNAMLLYAVPKGLPCHMLAPIARK
jgi:hypothetical protein